MEVKRAHTETDPKKRNPENGDEITTKEKGVTLKSLLSATITNKHAFDGLGIKFIPTVDKGVNRAWHPNTLASRE